MAYAYVAKITQEKLLILFIISNVVHLRILGDNERLETVNKRFNATVIKDSDEQYPK